MKCKRGFRPGFPQGARFQRENPVSGPDQERRQARRPRPLRAPKHRRLRGKIFFQRFPVQGDLTRVVPILAGPQQALRVRASHQAEGSVVQTGAHGGEQRRFEPAQRVEERAGQHQIELHAGVVAEHIQHAAVANAARARGLLAQVLVEEETQRQAEGHRPVPVEVGGGIITEEYSYSLSACIRMSFPRSPNGNQDRTSAFFSGLVLDARCCGHDERSARPSGHTDESYNSLSWNAKPGARFSILPATEP